jgi:hypothetical protein
MDGHLWPLTERVGMIGLAISLVGAAGCTSTPALGPDGSSASGVSGAAAAGGGGGSAVGTDAGPGVDCGPPYESAPCRADSDCRSAYLVCVPPDYETIELCRDPDAGVVPDPACPLFPEYDSAPICPQTVRVTSPVCEVRYQRPCTVDTDCGPVGFACTSGRCQAPDPAVTCTTAADCPTEWDCYVPCACPGLRETKYCEPPFVEFHCPNCGPVQP